MSAGDFRVSVRALPPDAYIKTIRMKTADVLQDGLHITGPNPDPLEIVIVADAGRLSGTVVTSKREPIGNAIVALVPRDLDPRRLDLFRSARTDDAGRFQLRGISAGAYVALAWEDVEDGAWQNPEFVQPYETQGTTVSIRDSSDSTVQLTAIPVR
jgi:hypothetical protein